MPREVLGTAAVVNASGTSLPRFQIGLILLGLGWNFAFIGVTTAVAAMAAEERATAQGLDDLLVFSAIAIASLLAGVVEYAAGWRVLNLAVLPLVCLAGLGIALQVRTGRDGASMAA